MSFNQFVTTCQFYLYGRRHCTRTGWQRASRNYSQPDVLDSIDLSTKVFIVTGANSGIGLECASFLAEKNAVLFMVCRNPTKGEAAKARIISSSNNEKVHLIVGDCSLQSGVNKIWQEFIEHRKCLGLSDGCVRLDGIMCNAGGLSTEKEAPLTTEGIETTLAAHLLFGTYHLVCLAMSTLENTPNSRVVVVSSGGMYNTKFPEWDIAAGRRGAYDGQLAYAYAKRGQVLLCEEWTKNHPLVKFASCHPGWVDTPGVESAYGSFKALLQPLRTPWEGAEGVLWLLTVPAEHIEGGGFYLDRTPCQKHLAGLFFSEGSYTRNTPEEVEDMISCLQRWSLLPLQKSSLETLLMEERAEQEVTNRSTRGNN